MIIHNIQPSLERWVYCVWEDSKNKISFNSIWQRGCWKFVHNSWRFVWFFTGTTNFKLLKQQICKNICIEKRFNIHDALKKRKNKRSRIRFWMSILLVAVNYNFLGRSKIIMKELKPIGWIFALLVVYATSRKH